MAYRVPTSDEKEALQSNAEFALQTKWAVKNLSLYWLNQDGANKNAADAEIWYKHRHFALQIMDNPAQNVDNVITTWIGLFGSYLNNYSMVDDSQAFNVQTAVEYMIAQNMFEPIANNVFDKKCTGIPF